MEKDRRSGQPYHIRPLESRSGSRPEKTVIDAKDTAATFSVSTRRGTTVCALPPKNRETINRYPVWAKTPIPNKNSTRPATLASSVVTATYNFIDQLISSLGITIATVCVSLIGYVNTTPQPTDTPTPAIKAMALFLYFGMPILGWICTLIAMRFFKLTKEEMVHVQKRIAEKKQAILESEA